MTMDTGPERVAPQTPPTAGCSTMCRVSLKGKSPFSFESGAFWATSTEPSAKDTRTNKLNFLKVSPKVWIEKLGECSTVIPILGMRQEGGMRTPPRLGARRCQVLVE